MSLVCALSGKVPKEAVFSPQGYIFENLEISSHLAVSQTCPFTGELLFPGQLRPLKIPGFHKAGVLPPPIPQLKAEVYSAIFERYQANLEISSLREELKNVLKKVHAAENLAKSFKSEVEDLQTKIAAMPKNLEIPRNLEIPQKNNISGNLEISQDLEIVDWEATMAGLPAAAQSLAVQRRAKIKISENLEISSLALLSSHNPHLSTFPGVVKIQEIYEKFIVSAGKDGRLIFFENSEKPVVVSAVSHGAKISSFDSAGGLCVSGGADGSFRLWLENEALTEPIYLVEKNSVRSVSLSNLSPEILLLGAGGILHSVDLENRKIRGIFPGQGDSAIFHPDGRLVFRQGSENLEIYSFEDRKMQGFLPAKSKIIAASENGVNVATAESEIVKIWDLRKPNSPLTEIKISASSLAFDQKKGKNILIGNQQGGGAVFEISSFSTTAQLPTEAVVHASTFLKNHRTIVAGTEKAVVFYKF